jgi:signal transduction histidine kinase
MLVPATVRAGVPGRLADRCGMFRRLRWLAIILPGLAVGLIELVSDSALDSVIPAGWDALVVVALVVLLAAVFSYLTFRRIDALAGALARQNAELARRNATVRALHRVSLAITALGELDRILEAIVEQARDLLHADGAALLVDGPGGEPTVRAASGRPIDPGPAQIGGSRLEASLQHGNLTFGRLVVGSNGQRTYGADDVETLASLANQAAIAIEHARLEERLRDLAVAEERERIAREMHDGLAQVLGYVNTKSQAVEHLLEAGRVVEARGQLDQLAAAARSIYVDVREAILGLRSAIDPGTGLIPAIVTYAARVADASKIVVDVRASEAARAARLPEPAERHLFRIVQEALTNVRKHAHAHRVEIGFEVVGQSLVVEIADDGRGMLAGDGPVGDWPRYGLAAMRERATAIGGSIEWLAGATGGTDIRVSIPLPTEVSDETPAAFEPMAATRPVAPEPGR